MHDIPQDGLMKIVADKLFASDVQNQNANLDEKSFGGRKGEATSALLKQFALDYCMSPQSKQNHINNEIYIHDLDSYALGEHNCLSIPFDDLLGHGFTVRQTDVRPANSINTAFQLVAVIMQIQSLQQFGGCSATHLDWTMVPYVRKSFYKHFRDGVHYLCPYLGGRLDTLPKELSFDHEEALKPELHDAYVYAMDMTKRELKQAVEGMYHNLNTLGRLNSDIGNIAI